MNRTDLQAIAFTRLSESEHLFKGSYYSGAYYLAGYVIECALKACIARKTQEHDFPDKNRVVESYSHDLAKLLRTAGLEQELRKARQQTPTLERKWDVVREWSEATRYEIVGQEDAKTMLDAVGNRDGGVLLWLMQFW